MVNGFIDQQALSKNLLITRELVPPDKEILKVECMLTIRELKGGVRKPCWSWLPIYVSHI